MAAHYHNITQQEMEAFLLPQGFRQIKLPRAIELVYAKIVAPRTSLRIFTGINPDGNSRSVGEDAIRVQLCWMDDSFTAHPVGEARRINRVQSWHKNLQERIDQWGESCPKCPTCGTWMKLRKIRHGPTQKVKAEFWGCALFPSCQGTRKKER